MSFRAGYIGLIGLPNAGKSTLVNTVIGEKCGIVSPKAQTTRKRVLGIYTDESKQAIFVDSPGVIKAERGINKFIQAEYQNIMQQSDALICCLNVDENDFTKLQEMIDLVKSANKPWAVIITKDDLGKIHRTPLLREKLKEYQVPVLAVSAENRKTESRELVLELIDKLLPESPAPLFSPELYTTSNLREMSSEIIREKCFLYLHEELPHEVAVLVRKYDEEGTITKIFADIIVPKDKHKLMVVGKGGSKLKQIGTEARKDIQAMLGHKVFLDLHVSVKENWAKNSQLMQELGYVVPE